MQPRRHTRQTEMNTRLWRGKNFRDEFLFLMFDFDLLYLMCTTERMSSTIFFFLFDLLPALTSNKQCPLVQGIERLLKYPEV